MTAAPPTPPLRLVLDAAGAVVSAGRTDFAPDPGQRVVEVPDAAYADYTAAVAALADGEEVTYDEGAQRFGKRARVKTAAEQAEAADKGARATRLARLDQDIAGYASLTAQERAAAQLNTMIIVRAITRRLLGE